MSIRVIANETTYFLRLDMLGQGELARVFPAYQQEPNEAHWAVKLAKDQQHNVYIEQEYHTLVKLHQAIALLPKEARAFPEVTPLPGVQLGAASDGRQALIMQPLLNQSLLAAYESLSTPLAREKLALTAARQYTDLLQALARANVSCQDRKLGDLWWVGPPETGHLVVTDWNVVSETANPAADLRRFGLLWFELIIGPQMPPNFQPKRQDFERVQDRVSYGLWYALGRALGSTMGPPWRHCQELADLLSDLAGFYRQPPLVLTQQARASLSRAQSSLDRSQADLAWIQFDIAQRLNNGKPVTGLDQARQWAYNPVAQAAPGLVRRLASPHFSEIGAQLQDLAQRVQRPQELGDINRLQFGFNLLNAIKDILVKGNTTTDLAGVAQQFTQAQELLVEGVLRPLMNKDGAAAAPNLSKLRALLPVKLAAPALDQFEALEQEAAFWLDYDAGQRNLHTQPVLAVASLENCRAGRGFIRHWPEAYEPTLDDLQRLQAIAETNARAAILAGETTAPSVAEPSSAGPSPTQPPHFWLNLSEAMLKQRWGDSLAELLAKLEREPGNAEVKAALEHLAQQLEQDRRNLLASRPSPARLAERANIVAALLQLPGQFAPDPATAQHLRAELNEARQLEQHIRQEQQELFQNPGPVLQRALAGGYEVFDDAGLSVAALTMLHKSGRWDNDRFDQDIARLQEQAERFLSLTHLLAERGQALEQALAVYNPFATAPSPTQTAAFLANTLRLYLSTAQAEIQAGRSASRSLERAGTLLAQAMSFLSPEEQAVYQDLYLHLADLDKARLNLQPVAAPVTEAQLESWFTAYQFEECYENLAGLKNETQRQKWFTCLNDAVKLREVVQQGHPKPTTNYFRKRQNSQLFMDTLDTLRHYAQEADPMAYALYAEEIRGLYEQVWQTLERLDKKATEQFEPKLQQ